MSLSLYKTCRACLDLCEDQKSLKETLKFEDEVLQIANIVETCIGLKIDNSDTLPDTLCLNCIMALRKAYEFRKQFIASDYFLKNNIEINRFMNEDLAVTNDVDVLENDDFLKHDNNEHFLDNDDFCNNDDDLFKIEDDNEEDQDEDDDEEEEEEKRGDVVESKQCKSNDRNEDKANADIKRDTNTQKEESCLVRTTRQTSTDSNDEIRLKRSKPSIPKTKKETKSATEVPEDLFQFKEKKKEMQDFICNICGKGIRCMPTTFKHHLKLHDPSKCIKCDFCGKLFPGWGQLKIHRMIHTGEKPFPCNLCPYSARLAETLNKHMKMHTGEKTFKCDQPGCDYVARHKTNLAHHKNVNHGNMNFECVVCHRLFRAERFLKRHMQIHQPGEHHPCDICHKTFSQKDYVRKHKRKVHKIWKRILPATNEATVNGNR